MTNYKPNETTTKSVGKEEKEKKKKKAAAKADVDDEDGVSVSSSTATSSSEFVIEEAANKEIIMNTTLPRNNNNTNNNLIINGHHRRRDPASPFTVNPISETSAAYHKDRCVSKRISTSPSSSYTSPPSPSKIVSGCGMKQQMTRPWGLICPPPPPPLHSISSSTTTATTNRSTSFGNRKRIRFSTVEIRQYGMCVGDNPSVTNGVPITITWTYSKDSSKIFGINEYERTRRECRRRCNSSDLKLSPIDRQDLLQKEFGISLEEIHIGQRNVQKCQAKRQWTKKTLILEPIQTWLEYSFRAIVNSTVRRRSKRKEKKELLMVLQ